MSLRGRPVSLYVPIGLFMYCRVAIALCDMSGAHSLHKYRPPHMVCSSAVNSVMDVGLEPHREHGSSKVDRPKNQ